MVGQLDRLIEEAARNPNREPDVFRALSDAVLYAHAPLGGMAGHSAGATDQLRLVMFRSPDDGGWVVPVFTDQAKAEFANRGGARLVRLVGRQLFEITRGATLMFNPNDVACTLYPEEISALLETGTLASIQKGQFDAAQSQVIKLSEVPAALVKALRHVLPAIRGVEAAYIAGLKWRDLQCPTSILIALGGRAENGDHKVRATAAGVQQVLARLDLPVDIAYFDSRKPAPDWIRNLNLQPVYRRRSGSAAPSPYN